jgi:hypothetical protein
VIGRSLSIWRRDLVLLFVLVLVVNLPRILYAIYRMLGPPPEPLSFDVEGPLFAQLAPLILRQHGVWLVRTLFVHVAQALVIFAVYQRLRGGAATFRQSCRGGLRRAWPVMRVALVLFALHVAIRILLVLASWFLATRVHLSFIHVFDIIPLVVLLTLSPFWVAVPAAVIERSRSFLKRSWILTRGHRLRVFLILLILYAVDWGIGRLFAVVRTDLPQPWCSAVWWAQDLLLVALAAVLAVVGYHALRLEKDGVDASEFVGVFA